MRLSVESAYRYPKPEAYCPCEVAVGASSPSRIAHVLFGQCTRKAVREIPLWFIEGIAIYFAEEWVPSRHETLLKHIFSKSIIPLQELERSFPRTQAGADLAYAESQDTVRWLVEVKGRDVLFSLIAELHAGSNFRTAFETVSWMGSCHIRYSLARIADGTLSMGIPLF